MNSEYLKYALIEAGNHLWQATLFVLIAGLAVWLLKDAPARTRSAVWIAASLKFALPLALFAWIGAQAGVNLSKPAPEAATAAASAWMIVEPIAATSGPASPISRPGVWRELVPLAIAVVWLVGFSVSLGFWFAGRRRLSLSITAGRTIHDGREYDALERARARVGVSRSVGLIVSWAIHEPGVWRVFRPVVVLPEGVAAELSDSELETVMMHEVAHVARRDNLIANIHMFLCCAFWFHPAVWWIDKQLVAERERACDEAVLQAGGGGKVYAAGLLKVFRFTIGWRPAGVSCATGSHLGRRIEVIMGDSSDRIATAWHHAVTAAVVVLLAGVSFTAAAFSSTSGPSADGGQQTTEEREVVIEKSDDGPGASNDLAQLAAGAPVFRELKYTNQAGSPIAITSAEIKKVPASELAKAMGPGGQVRKIVIKTDGPDDGKNPAGSHVERNALPPTDKDGNTSILVITLQNVSARVVSGYQLGGDLSKDDNVLFVFKNAYQPGSTFTIAVPALESLVASDDLVLSVLGSQFDDGTVWGDWKDPAMEHLKHGR